MTHLLGDNVRLRNRIAGLLMRCKATKQQLNNQIRATECAKRIEARIRIDMLEVKAELKEAEAQIDELLEQLRNWQ